MTAVEELEQEAYDQNVPVDYVKFKSDHLHGLYIDGSIAIHSGLNAAQTADTLAEELEHHYTSYGNMIDMNNLYNRKQERQARLQGYNRMIGLCGIVSAFKAGCQNRFEVAEHLHVTEEYLQEAIDCYTGKYGEYATLDNYIIYFIPYLGVMEMI